MLKICDLKTEYRANPIGIDARSPRFSWKLKSDGTNVMQSSYRIRVSAAPAAGNLNQTLLWDSGIVNGAQSQQVRYAGPALRSRQRLVWTVEVTAEGERDGRAFRETARSEEAVFEMGLLDPADWQAKWIQPERDVDYDAYKPAPRLRKTFRVKKGLQSARIYQSAHGLYEFYINGAAGTRDKFKPGFTSYHHRIPYQTHDITDLLREEDNVWAVLLGDGWWRGNTGGGNRNNFGFYVSFIGQIVLTYEDGTTGIIGTDESFVTAPGALLRCDMKVGELYDARLADDWTAVDYDDSGWLPVVPATEYASTEGLIAAGIPVVERESFEAEEFTDAERNRVLDFGQNHAGYVKMRLRNTQPGQTVTLSHGEGLKDGAFSTANIEEISKDPFQQIVYLCKGAAIEEYTPSFAVFGWLRRRTSRLSRQNWPRRWKRAAIP